MDPRNQGARAPATRARVEAGRRCFKAVAWLASTGSARCGHNPSLRKRRGQGQVGGRAQRHHSPGRSRKASGEIGGATLDGGSTRPTAPAAAAVVIECASDQPQNRTAPRSGNVLDRHNAKLAYRGLGAYGFKRRGTVDLRCPAAVDEEKAARRTARGRPPRSLSEEGLAEPCSPSRPRSSRSRRRSTRRATPHRRAAS